MHIIIISGKQGSGKTTLQKELAKLIRERTGDFVQTVKFADVIYKIHDYARNVLKELGIEPTGVKDGDLLQLLGTDWGRKKFGDNIWCQIAKNKIANIKLRGFKYVIIDDCRFENEFDFFPEALRVRLVCPKEIRKARAEMWRENDSHASEVGLDKYSEDMKFDLYLNTDGEYEPYQLAETIFKNLETNMFLLERKKS